MVDCEKYKIIKVDDEFQFLLIFAKFNFYY